MFAAELARWGPQRDYDPPPLRDARNYCRWLALTHYENFSVASVFLPRRLLRHAHNVYAYCRWADDLADETTGMCETTTLLEWWRGELLACYEGTPRHPVLVALRETVRRFDIPPKPFLDLISAFEQDQSVKSYGTMAELRGYCANSANPVGRIVLHLGECHDEMRGRLSDDICTALQLTNFWQDVARDLQIGRIYVPEANRRTADASFRARSTSPEFRAMMADLVQQTRQLFHRGLPLVRRVPEELRVQIELFVRGGLAILRKIERRDYDVWSCRPTLSKWEKAMLVAQVAGRHYAGVPV